MYVGNEEFDDFESREKRNTITSGVESLLGSDSIGVEADLEACKLIKSFVAYL